MSVSVVLPSYREAENLKKILPLINKVLQDANILNEVIVVDTMNPTDETKTVCELNNSTYVLRKPTDSYGDAIRTGFKSAKNKYTVVMDADGSHDPKDIVEFYNQMKTGKWDLIVGSRYIKGGKTHNPFILKLLSCILNLTYRVVLDIRIKDVSNSFRMYKTEQIKNISLVCSNFDLVEEILVKLMKQNSGFSIKEVPIFFDTRMYGKSKRNLVKFIFSYIHTMIRLYKIKRNCFL